MSGVPGGVASEARLSILQSDSSGIRVVLRTPPEVAATWLDAGQSVPWLNGSSVLTHDVCGLPQISVLLGVPPQAGIALVVASSTPIGLTTALLGDEEHTGDAGSDVCGGQAAAIEAEGWLRELRVVRLVLRPLVSDASGRGARLRREIVADLAFEGAGDPDGGRPDPHWDRVLASQVANWDSARIWRVSQGAVTPPRANPLAASGAWKVAVNQTGWQSLAVTALTQTGLPPGTPPQAIRLYDEGREVPLHIIGGEDGRLEGQDRIAFYGQAKDTRYTDTNIYWLDVVRSGSGLRIASADAAPPAGEPLAAFTETLRLEVDSVYDGRTPPLPGEDHYYWSELRPGDDGAVQRISFSLPGLQAGPGQVRLRLKGASVAANHVRVQLNGGVIADERWSGPLEHRIGAERSDAADFREAANELIIEALGDPASRVLVDWLEVDYPSDFQLRGSSLEFTAEADAPCEIQGLPARQVEIFDVTAAESPVRLEGAVVRGSGPYSVRFQTLGGRRYVVVPEGGHHSPTVAVDAPDDLTAPAAADIIILAPQELRAPALTLRTYRAQQGFRVRLVDVQDAFDAFSDGEPDPAAIRALVAGAFVWWRPPAPSYLVLMGDGHVDFRGFTTATPWRVPVDLVEDGFDPGEIPSDNALAVVSGNDVLPDIVVGRLAVTTAEEGAQAVARLQQYEQQAAAPWHGQLALFADDGPADAPAGSSFGELLERLAVGLPEDFQVDAVVLATSGEPSAAAMRARIAEVFDEGRAVIAYLGDGEREAWAAEHIWTVADAAALANAPLPLMLELTAASGYFAAPGQRSLAEVHSVRSLGGAIASWASAGSRSGPGHEILGQAWLRGVYSERLRGGSAATAAKIALFGADPSARDLIVGFNWLGDPALGVVGTFPRDPASPTPLGSPSATGSPPATPTSGATPEATPTASESPTSAPTSATHTATMVASATLVPTPTATVEPQASPTVSATPTATVAATPAYRILLPRIERNYVR